MPTVLITGAAGFIGGAAVRRFVAEGWRVVGVDLVKAEAPVDDVQWSSAPIGSSAFESLIREQSPDIVLHCAGSASVPASFVDIRGDFESNVALTSQVLDALRRHSPMSKFLLMSSAAVYGNPDALPISEDSAPRPISPYGFHKLMAEQLVREYAVLHGIRGAALRVFSAYGLGLRRQVIWDICQKLTASASVRLQGTGDESRDFVHVDDVVLAAAVIAERAPLRGEVYNVAEGRERRISDVAARLAEVVSPGARIEFDGKLPAGTPSRWRADVAKVKALGFACSTVFNDAIANLAIWINAHSQRRQGGA